MDPVTNLPAEVHVVAPDRPFAWLVLGWRDLLRAPAPGLLHGLVFLCAALGILWVGWGRGDLLAGAFSGFLLIAPALCTGMYETSRRLARGERPSVADVLSAWGRGGPSMIGLGLLLAGLGTFWVAASALIVLVAMQVSLSTGAASGSLGSVSVFLNGFVLSPDHWPFLLWLLAGGILAAVVFAVGVVSMPLILDRRIGLRAAMLTSVRVVGRNPVTMALWALIVMVLTAVAIVTGGLLIVFVPLLGHATWHAYSETVDSASLPPRI